MGNGIGGFMGGQQPQQAQQVRLPRRTPTAGRCKRPSDALMPEGFELRLNNVVLRMPWSCHGDVSRSGGA